MKWQEAEALQETAGRARRAVVIGGGLIGLKAAEALHHLGVEVSVVDLAAHVLPAAADAVAAVKIENHLREIGLKLYTGTTVEKIEGNKDRVKGVALKTGEKLPADLVVIAIGVKPNTQIVEGTSIKVRKGILVDSHMRTTAPEVYAAGDVAEGYDLVMGENRLLPLWPVAYRQGAVAGANMAGQPEEYTGFFAMNSIELFGLPLISMGRLEAPPGSDYEVLAREDARGYRKIILKDGIIEGAIFLHDIDRAGIVTGLMREKLPVKGFKDDLLAEGLGLLALPHEWRKEKLSSPNRKPTGPE
jgi:NAD(P)H-nitrite reductase large subunit